MDVNLFLLLVGLFRLARCKDRTEGESAAAAHIAEIEARLGGRIGVAALDTGSGKRFDYQSQERFPMCSTFKFLAAAAVVKQVDQGKEKL
ncbi:MAG TPA: serine hydrolase [Candidatus Udaeobacter sp.]